MYLQMNMKLAHLLLVHSNPKQVERLIKRLLYPPFVDIYIHLDRKADFKEFQSLASIESVYFIKKRVSVGWGNYSMVAATLKSFKEILASEVEYCHINLLSGQDYPLKQAQEIQKFLFAHPGNTFMSARAIPDEWEVSARLQKYNLGGINIHGRYLLERIVNKILPKRKVPNQLKVYGRSQWFTITPHCVAYIIRYLEENRNVKRFFKWTWGADELIFQTILFNSNLKDSIVNNNLRYIKFEAHESRPKILTI